jgi:hypothetical protein
VPRTSRRAAASTILSSAMAASPSLSISPNRCRRRGERAARRDRRSCAGGSAASVRPIESRRR